MQILNIFHVLLAIALVAIILVQRGAGATAGAAFGSGASGTVFGSRGAGSFLTRATAWLAIGFFGLSLTMAVLASRSGERVVDETSIMSDTQPAVEQPAASGSDVPALEIPAGDAADVPQVQDAAEQSDVPGVIEEIQEQAADAAEEDNSGEEGDQGN